MIYRRLLCLAAVLAVLAAPGYASAQELLWDSPPNNGLAAFVDQQFPDFPDFNTYDLGCVLVPDNDGDFLLTDVITYFTNFNNTWPIGPIDATLNVVEQPGGGGLPPNDYFPEPPELGGQGITVTGELIGEGDRLELRANVSDAGVVLVPGTKYWIGLTPVIDFGIFGQEFHKGSDFFIKNTACRNSGGAFGVGTDWFECGPAFGGIDWGMAVTVFGKKIGEGFCPPTSFTVLRGFVVSCELSDFEFSDDVRCRMNPGFVLNSSEAPVWLIFDANCPTAIDFLVESQAGTPGLTYTVEAWNWNTNSYDIIGDQDESFNNDTVSTFPIVPVDHIDSDGDVRSRVGWRKTGITINFPWEVRIDQVGWTF